MVYNANTEGYHNHPWQDRKQLPCLAGSGWAVGAWLLEFLDALAASKEECKGVPPLPNFFSHLAMEKAYDYG